MINRYKIVIAYDGTDFAGWQIQAHDVTVAGQLQKTFKSVFGQDIKILGASRTDTGVHALGQVATFLTDVNVLVDDMLRAWNSALPTSIKIRSLEQVDESFHPFGNVDYKIYQYHLFLRSPLPHVARYGWYYCFVNQVNWSVFEQCLKLAVGTHDFASFCKQDAEDPKPTIRTIFKIKIEHVKALCAKRVTIKGPGFGRYQIRRMIGYALDIARRPDKSIADFKALLNNPQPRQELVRAEAQGLCLRKIVYLRII